MTGLILAVGKTAQPDWVAPCSHRDLFIAVGLNLHLRAPEKLINKH